MLAGNGFNQLNGPYDAKQIGDYTGLTPPFDFDFEHYDYWILLHFQPRRLNRAGYRWRARHGLFFPLRYLGSVCRMNSAR